jgi:hypothetical protein
LTVPAEELPQSDSQGRGYPTIDRRVFYIHDAQLLATLAEDRKRLILRRLDLVGALRKEGRDFLFVSSTAPRLAAEKKEYRYTVDVQSSRGGVVYRLESGPPGMQIDAMGRLTWKAPKRTSDEVSVLISLRDASGASIFHSFSVVIR